jgi:hypothetical protein
LPPPVTSATGSRALAALVERAAAANDLDEAITAALGALDELFGFTHSLVMALDPNGASLVTIASHGYERAGIGSEVNVGHGVIGAVAANRRPMRVNNLQRMLTYAKAATRPDESTARAGTDVPLPDLPKANSQLVAPAIVLGELVGVVAVESDRLGAFSDDDEVALIVAAHVIGTAMELDRLDPHPDRASARAGSSRDAAPVVSGPKGTVRFFASDGSTFVDGDYLVKGVPGRILWRLLCDHDANGRTEFTNRELRLDPALELPPYRDNLESRLVLLKRRLEERDAPMRIEKAGRGRLRLLVTADLTLETAGS